MFIVANDSMKKGSIQNCCHRRRHFDGVAQVQINSFRFSHGKAFNWGAFVKNGQNLAKMATVKLANNSFQKMKGVTEKLNAIEN